MRQCVRRDLREQGARTILLLPSKDQINFRPMNGEQFTARLSTRFHSALSASFRHNSSCWKEKALFVSAVGPQLIVAWQGKQTLSPAVSRSRSGLAGETQ
jgi:hypothetical protein